jgi:ribonucleoside-triphosphate reductase
MARELAEKHSYEIPRALREELEEAVLGFEVVPSMRALMTAGTALERDNTCGYNCSYLPIDDIKSFDEAMFILLCGTGVGFSVEQQYVQKLPSIPDKLFPSETTIVVKDSKEGWAKALRQLIALLYSGEIPKWDVSKVRPAGARLKTFGGRSSGPGPLEELFRFVSAKFEGARGRKLTSLECHDILCKIGAIVVVGGVRRSAMISLSDLTDEKIRYAKSGNWWEYNVHRALANNSVAYEGKPDVGTFLREWTSLYDSKSGERGIFNREASRKKASENNRRDSAYDFGTNPCSEIILRANQFCNLTEVVVRASDTHESLSRKVRLATVLGTYQSTLTNFPYLRKIWQTNTEEERLLGVSLTGIMDNELLNGSKEFENLPNLLSNLRGVAVSTNQDVSAILGINPSTAITCVKPSGTVSQLVDSASGIHSRYSRYYIRTVRIDNKDPIRQFLVDRGVSYEPDVTSPENITVFSFPMAAPDGAVLRGDLSAVQELEHWLVFQRYWCEHKPSVTINVKEHEWFAVGAWVYENFDEVSGVSFLPFDDHIYQQAPYQPISKDEYERLYNSSVKEINWKDLSLYETTDGTVGTQSLACSADSCEVVDLVK